MKSVEFDNRITSITTYNGIFMVAAGSRIYGFMYVQGKFRPVGFEEMPTDER